MSSLRPLPIDRMLTDIAEAVRSSASVVLTATPGAGKTTRLPPELLNCVSGKIAVLQPRRMAAVAACHRVCDEQGWKIGEQCGYQVRFDGRSSAQTRLLFMTDALLLRRLVGDPELSEFSLIVIDEFHERNVHQDLILGCVRELQELGSPIKLLLMSATLDLPALQRFIPDAKFFDVPGRVFPLEIRHLSQPLRLQTDRVFTERVVQATVAATRETEGDVLVFLPGVGEIARVSEQLAGARLRRPIIPLHGSLPLEQQSEALRAPSSPRVILATNVAEASVTVQGVDFVIDTGVARVMEMNLNSGFSSLELTRISQFNARQRAGRAARERAGTCLRLWTAHEEVTQLLEMPPECARVDLSSSLSTLAHLGVTDFRGFAWFTPPPSRLLDMAIRSLRSTGAIDAQGRITAMGQKLMRYPLPPRLGATLALSEERGESQLGAWTCAVLNERDFVDRAATTRTECDVTFRLGILQEGGRGRAREVLESARQLEKMCRPGAKLEADPGDDVRRLLLLSQTDRLCRRRGHSDRGVMVGGRGVRLKEDTQVKESDFFLALQGIDLPGQPETQVNIACGMSKAFLLETLPALIEIREDVEFNEEKGRFFARRMRTILGLALEDPSLTPVDAASVAERMAEILAGKWEWLATQNEQLGQWMKRWNFLLSHDPSYAEQLGAQQILQTVEMAAFGKDKVSEVIASNIVELLQGNLPPETIRTLNREVPEKFIAPTGHEHRIQYELHGAYVEIRLQEMFGLLVTPRLAFGRAPMTFRLLSPGYRPMQVTSDLEGFWRTAYFEVRKELRTRYPKHAWPEDPLTAKPEAKGRRRT